VKDEPIIQIIGSYFHLLVGSFFLFFLSLRIVQISPLFFFIIVLKKNGILRNLGSILMDYTCLNQDDFLFFCLIEGQVKKRFFCKKL